MTPAGVNVKHTDKLWINGRWVAAHSGRVIELISPNTEQVIMLNKLVEDEEDAIRAARTACAWISVCPMAVSSNPASAAKAASRG